LKTDVPFFVAFVAGFFVDLVFVDFPFFVGACVGAFVGAFAVQDLVRFVGKPNLSPFSAMIPSSC